MIFLDKFWPIDNLIRQNDSPKVRESMLSFLLRPKWLFSISRRSAATYLHSHKFPILQYGQIARGLRRQCAEYFVALKQKVGSDPQFIGGSNSGPSQSKLFILAGFVVFIVVGTARAFHRTEALATIRRNKGNFAPLANLLLHTFYISPISSLSQV